MARYLWQEKDWPAFHWDAARVAAKLGDVRYRQGILLGKMSELGYDARTTAFLDTLTTEAIQSAAIEGELLSVRGVRSSLANRLGILSNAEPMGNRDEQGMADMLYDATVNAKQPLTDERLHGWHAALFPTGYSGMYPIEVGRYRTDSTGPMQVVSGAFGREIVHFQAPPATDLPDDMRTFLAYVNAAATVDEVIKAAVAHLWFVTIYPFDDGNGRIGRAVTDLLLTRADGFPQRFYSVSAQIKQHRKLYYRILEATQASELDITAWLLWFLEMLRAAVAHAERTLAAVLQRQRFWTVHQTTALNSRQRLVLVKLLDDFFGKLSSGKWAKMAKCSTDTALRDIQDLIEKGILEKTASGGRSTHYQLRAPAKY